MTALKMIVFDMAGTTVRDLNEVEDCFAKACKQTGLDVSDETIKAVQGWAKHHVFKTLWTEKLGEGHPELEQKINQSYHAFRTILEQHYHEHEILPTEGALEIFEYCRNHGIKIVLTTGFYRKVTDIILEKLGWLKGLNEQKVAITDERIIDASVSSDEVKEGRPAPDLVFRAMELMKITNPKEVIVVGDTPSDLGCGKNAGVLLTYGLTNGTHRKEQLEKYSNDGLLPSLKSLQALLEEKTPA